MSDVREVFPILELANGTGQTASARTDGDAAAAQYGIIGFSFKDSSGNVVLPQLSPNGELPTINGVPTICKSQYGELLAGSLTIVDLATITLTASTDYKKIEATGSCFRDTLFEIVQVDDATETQVDAFLIGAGQYSFKLMLECSAFASGATGTQELILRATNINKASALRGRISVEEVI